ncbi:SMODS domain-containing nucleotidyltransferase [Dyadobacter sp. CY347]|uniref:SMODS domain-containing nucleotidyltransferase n=1 Tax=Dyadobacter sp. CY347 TaxID=2909336 RepID=UPI001F447F7C|nr:hypothetical protein [Dyadobacter sp. CY347]MCF2489133.1 hypothetical protein [Dyadobacter sp. CY347]
MNTSSYFNLFLSNIRLTPKQKKNLIEGHTTLRSSLAEDPKLKNVIVTTFLQGSYRRATALKDKNAKRADVDVVVVTNFDRNKVTPNQALEYFRAFLDIHYPGAYKFQGRSISITLPDVDMDLVITSAPSEVNQKVLGMESVTDTRNLEELGNDWRMTYEWTAPERRDAWTSSMFESLRKSEEWKAESLYIPDREKEDWEETNPLEQIRWTRDKNKATNSHYVNVVKALKWWRMGKLTNRKYPKGYPIEHMIGDCCPDDIKSVAEGVVKTLDKILATYRWNRLTEKTPELIDRGVTSHNVWKRVSDSDFINFYDHVKDAAATARLAFDSENVSDQIKYWRELFGEEFPPLSEEDARNERLQEKSKLLESGILTVNSKIQIVAGSHGLSVPKERNHYEITSDL